MFRALRLIIFVVLLVGAVAFFFGYRGGWKAGVPLEPPAGTTGASVNHRTERARAAGATIGERVADGAARADRLLDETRLTAKVKSKIALDDTLKESDVSVSTTGTTVTVDGRVSNAAQRQRVLQLVRETAGVTEVVDRLAVGSQTAPSPTR